MKRELWLLLLLTVLIRVPFLNQAIQGDDPYYLAGAQYAQTDPLHPSRARFLFMGEEVTMQGHPHPPFNVWFLALLLAAVGEVKEVPFHAAYVVFSLIAVAAMYSLAQRFSPWPVLATLCFLGVPAFVVNGNSLEADLPFLAFWMASAALYVSAVDTKSGRRLAAAAAAMAICGLNAYQAVLIVPVLAVYLWKRRRDWKAGWLALGAAPSALVLWQLFELLTTGVLPAAVMGGYFQTYGLQRLAAKGSNALGLVVHLAWMLCPVLALLGFGLRPARRWAWIAAGIVAATGSLVDPNPLFWAFLGCGVLILSWAFRETMRPEDKDSRFLAAWVLVFVAGAMAIFFAGAARYLLPVAAPLSILLTKVLRYRPRWILLGASAHLMASLALATVNYQHWDGYRRFVAELRPQMENRRVWINAEWGLRFYLEAEGALPVRRGQRVEAGEIVVASALALPVPLTPGGVTLVPTLEREIRSLFPLRLIGLGSKSGYSTVGFGLRPFDFGTGPIDRVRAMLATERTPTLEYVSMNAPEAEEHIVSGVYQLEEGRFRWMGKEATLMLKGPQGSRKLEVSIYVSEAAPARRLQAWLDGQLVLDRPIPGPGLHTFASDPVQAGAGTARLTIAVDKTFQPAGDQRVLGVVLLGAGFRQVQ